MASILKLLDKQAAIWELKHRMEELSRPGRCVEEGVAYGPCLLVSRECGSGGDELARQAAERLGWQLYDREILDQIAQLANVRGQLLNTVDAKTRSIWGEEWQTELAPEHLGFEKYLRYLRQVVLTFAHHGDVVLLGRGAPYLVPARCSLRLRVVAPLEARLRRMLQTNGMTAQEAQHRLEQIDTDRAAFIQQSFRQDPRSPLNYDLVINTGEISLPAALELTLQGLQAKLSIRVPKR